MKTIYTILIILMTSVLTLICDFYICNPQQPGTIIIETVHHVIKKDSLIYISKTKIKEIPKNNFIYLKDTIFVTDTVWLINDYFAKYNYIDTLKNDSSAKIIISDTVFMNKLYNRVADVSIYNKTIIQKNPVFLTAGVFYLQNKTFNSIGLKVGLNTFKNVFSAGYGTNKTILLSYDRNFKIK